MASALEVRPEVCPHPEVPTEATSVQPPDEAEKELSTEPTTEAIQAEETAVSSATEENVTAEVHDVLDEKAKATVPDAEADSKVVTQSRGLPEASATSTDRAFIPPMSAPPGGYGYNGPPNQYAYGIQHQQPPNYNYGPPPPNYYPQPPPPPVQQNNYYSTQNNYNNTNNFNHNNHHGRPPKHNYGNGKVGACFGLMRETRSFFYSIKGMVGRAKRISNQFAKLFG